MRAIIEGDTSYLKSENLASEGYTTQEFDENEELINVEDDLPEGDDLLDDAE